MEKNSNMAESKSMLTMRRNNLAALIEGWGVPVDHDLECNCEDCDLLRPLIAELNELDNELRYN